jgi:hypothetical protein
MFFIWPTECMYLQQSIGLMLLNVSKVDHHYFMHPHVGLLGLKLFAHESDKSWKLLIETKKWIVRFGKPDYPILSIMMTVKGAART